MITDKHNDYRTLNLLDVIRMIIIPDISQFKSGSQPLTIDCKSGEIMIIRQVIMACVGGIIAIDSHYHHDYYHHYLCYLVNVSNILFIVMKCLFDQFPITIDYAPHIDFTYSSCLG